VKPEEMEEIFTWEALAALAGLVVAGIDRYGEEEHDRLVEEQWNAINEATDGARMGPVVLAMAEILVEVLGAAVRVIEAEAKAVTRDIEFFRSVGLLERDGPDGDEGH